MKKLAMIAIAVIGLACLSTHKADAQTTGVYSMTNPNGQAIDTASQAAAEAPFLKVSGPAKTVSIVVKTTKISGTIAGTVAFQGSNDGVNYATIVTATALVDASTNYLYKETDKGFLYYRALITQTGTSSLSYSGKLYTTPTK